jgi:hypothetical protein
MVQRFDILYLFFIKNRVNSEISEFQKIPYTPDPSLSFKTKLWEGFNKVFLRGKNGELYVQLFHSFFFGV